MPIGSSLHAQNSQKFTKLGKVASMLILLNMRCIPSSGTGCFQDAQDWQLSPADFGRPQWGPFPEPELV